MRDAGLWEVIRPARPSRVAGVGMAGFRDRGVAAAGQRVIPHPAVTLALEFGAGPPRMPPVGSGGAASSPGSASVPARSG